MDLGTTGVRAVAFGASGEVVASASEGVSLVRPAAGLVEQDPAEVIAAAEAAIRRVADGASARADAPEAMALAVLGEAMLPLATDGTPLARIAVSMDTRGEDSARALASAVAPGALHRDHRTAPARHVLGLQDRCRVCRLAGGRRIPLRR
ncbi:FGGY family carbohydrate kinase [Pseudonocardia sp. MH-G8]|uniref:FGGY family carbohydrate kinase n=1 Tax=Pseudonocardia sp. MH-G8 TaxID=1854588 RepID=UPI0013043A46|nr:FGGY family carbohydrate kinase [Pseudonocardia sp. MH-G8]